MEFFKKCILCLVLIGLSWYVNGQKTVSFQNLSKKDGLSQVSVFGIAQDRSGFMWFGTRSGLNRFDGYQFKVYKRDTSHNSLVADDIRHLYVDPQSGELWVGTILGLGKYRSATDDFVNYQHSSSDISSLSANVIRQVFRDSKGRLWVGTSTGLNLYLEEDDSFIRYYIKDRTGNNPVNKDIRVLSEDSNGQIWIGTNDGVYSLLESAGGAYTFERKDGLGSLHLSDPYIMSMLVDRLGNFWIGTFEGGLHYWDKQREKTTVYQSDKNDSGALSHNKIRSMCLDQDGNLWVGTFDGLNFLEKHKSTFTVFHKNENGSSGLSDNSIHSVFLDERGSLWAGTYYGGVNHQDDNYNQFTNFQYHPYKNSLNTNVVSSFAEDKDGNLWIGTEGGGGLNFYDQKRNWFESYQYAPGKQNTLSGNNIKQLLLDKDKLWIGTFQAGLNVLGIPSKKFAHYKHDPHDVNSLASNNVYGLRKDANKLWILTYEKGLDILDLEKDTFYHYPVNPLDSQSISSNLTRVFLETKNRQLWIGTEKGLNKVTTDRLGFPFTFQTFFADEKIYSLAESQSGNIWIGTFHNGFYYFNPEDGAREQYTTDDGLSGNSIFGIIEMSKDELWLSTNNGLSKFNPKDKSFTNYDYSSGLANLEHNFNAYYQTKSGDLLFGGINGFTRFNPKEIKLNQFVPPIVFTQLLQNNKVVKIDQEGSSLEQDINVTDILRFKYNEANFSISFAALDYFNPEHNRYAYMLEGLDRDWNYSEGKTEVTYAIQREGDYVFRLKGANSDGVWNPEERRLNILVSPPAYRTWWAYLIYLAIITVAVLGLVRYIRLQHKLQLQNIEKQKQEELLEMKLRFFTNITHEFRTPLTLILGPLKELIANKEQEKREVRQLSLIERNAQRLLNLVNQLMTFRKLATDHEPLRIARKDIIEFLQEIFLPFQETAGMRNIEYYFETEIKELQTWFDPDKLEKVFFNLLSNAFKFTPDGGHIVMQVSRNNDQLEVKVSDSGVGIDAQMQEHIFKRFYEKASPHSSTIKGSGIGLAISKQMVELHGGKIFLDTNKEASKYTGATFTVQIPLSEKHFKKDVIVEKYKEQDKITAYLPSILSKPVSPPLIVEERALNTEDAPLLLVVEDNKEVRTFIQQIFINEYRVIIAENGVEGLKKAKEKSPDLIISDVMMPQMDGITFCQKLKSDITISHIPIILLTARTAALFKIEGLKMGADDYVTKPFNPEELQLRVRNTITLRQEIRDKFARVLNFDPKEIKITSADEQFLENAMEIVERNIDNYGFNVIQFASEIAVSRPLLFTKLKALTGQTPNNFIKTIRLKRAAQLLKQNKLQVSEVASKIGFKDSRYFSKCFQQHFGVKPSEFK